MAVPPQKEGGESVKRKSQNEREERRFILTVRYAGGALVSAVSILDDARKQHVGQIVLDDDVQCIPFDVPERKKSLHIPTKCGGCGGQGCRGRSFPSPA